MSSTMVPRRGEGRRRRERHADASLQGMYRLYPDTLPRRPRNPPRSIPSTFRPPFGSQSRNAGHDAHDPISMPTSVLPPRPADGSRPPAPLVAPPLHRRRDELRAVFTADVRRCTPDRRPLVQSRHDVLAAEVPLGPLHLDRQALRRVLVPHRPHPERAVDRPEPPRRRCNVTSETPGDRANSAIVPPSPSAPPD